LLAEVLNKHRRMITAESRRFDERRLRLISAARGLGRPEDVTGALGQRLDLQASRLAAALRSRSDLAARAFAGVGGRFTKRTLSLGFERKRLILQGVAQRLSARRLSQRLLDYKKSLIRDAARLDAIGQLMLKRPTERLAAASGLLRSLSYKSVLDRGFALVKKPGGKFARRAADLPASGAVALVFADGERAAHLGEAPKKPAPPKKPVQKTLFD
jgi:exodeoxyribonuclease VII large subunit